MKAFTNVPEDKSFRHICLSILSEDYPPLSVAGMSDFGLMGVCHTDRR